MCEPIRVDRWMCAVCSMPASQPALIVSMVCIKNSKRYRKMVFIFVCCYLIFSIASGQLTCQNHRIEAFSFFYSVLFILLEFLTAHFPYTPSTIMSIRCRVQHNNIFFSFSARNGSKWRGETSCSIIAVVDLHARAHTVGLLIITSKCKWLRAILVFTWRSEQALAFTLSPHIDFEKKR